jgi:hypothetical protein
MGDSQGLSVDRARIIAPLGMGALAKLFGTERVQIYRCETEFLA